MTKLSKSEAVLTHFHSIAPEYQSTQEETLHWITAAHTKAHAEMSEDVTTEELEAFREELNRQLYRVGCKPHMIFRRGHVIDDFLHQDWKEMAVYRLEDSPEGVGLQKRQEICVKVADEIFDHYYPTQEALPEQLIHVSCTAYAAPSSAQKLVSRRNAGKLTTVTHAYHMGCYGAIAAIRIGAAFAKQGVERSDIVHTEFCSLHMNPSLHSPDQLVGQSLFADGFIKYSIVPEQQVRKDQLNGLKILAIRETILPDCVAAMEWNLNDWGFLFLLSKEIPVLICKHVREYVQELCEQAGVAESEVLEQGVFAVHPGGPKILDYLEKVFNVSPERLRLSREVLQYCGNMSSATVPHVWDMICRSEEISKKTKVLSLAFGPGLTIAGALMEKV